jgi:hypothetical protein
MLLCGMVVIVVVVFWQGCSSWRGSVVGRDTNNTTTGSICPTSRPRKFPKSCAGRYS